MDLAKRTYVSKKSHFPVSLAGNPNTGKSTVFNRLTGLRQHTGNWTGKTVTGAAGTFSYADKTFDVVDLPGTYSLNPKSDDESEAAAYIGRNDGGVIIIVLDATCLERNLIFALRILRRCRRCIVCINLIDEAAKKKIRINIDRISDLLGVPVIATNAKQGAGIKELKRAVYEASLSEAGGAGQYQTGDSIGEIAAYAGFIANESVTFEKDDYNSIDRKIDNIIMSKRFGIPIMLAMLFAAFWITVSLANYPSSILMSLFASFEISLHRLLLYVKCPEFVTNAVVFGVYRVLSWVIAVMLPPMVIAKKNLKIKRLKSKD